MVRSLAPLPLVLAALACSAGLPAVTTATSAPVAAPPTPAAVAAPRHTLTFDPLPASNTPEERRQLRFTEGYTLDGEHRALNFQPLVRSGDTIGGRAWGQVLDVRGEVVRGDDGAPAHCKGTAADFSGLWQAHNNLFLVQHIECVPSAVWLTTLDMSPEGKLTPTRTRPVDLAPIGGAINTCAGQISPWNTLISSEEYEIDARKVPNADVPAKGDDYNWRYMAKYTRTPATELSAYGYGWIPEVSLVNAEGETKITRHLAMGRFSHEVAIVLPDEKTVYLSDDTSAGGALFMFIADVQRKLDAGKLYAAAWTPGLSAADPIVLKWIDLGHASDADIQAALDARVSFQDLFETAPPSGGACPAGFAAVSSTTGDECLKVIAGKEQLASRLESRRYAGVLGATTELTKGEGLVFDPTSRTVYFATSTIDGRMAKGGQTFGSDHLQLDKNACGAVWALETGPGAAVGVASQLVAQRARIALAGSPRSYTSDPERALNTCDVDRIANPDNLAFLPATGTLFVAEDSRRHENMALWAWQPGAELPARVATTPWAGEVTGIQWSPDLRGHAYLTLTVQHPMEEGYKIGGFEVPGPSEPTITGVLGPFPLMP